MENSLYRQRKVFPLRINSPELLVKHRGGTCVFWKVRAYRTPPVLNSPRQPGRQDIRVPATSQAQFGDLGRQREQADAVTDPPRGQCSDVTRADLAASPLEGDRLVRHSQEVVSG